jgi:DNA-binding beta-propeller fold protein YncE
MSGTIVIYDLDNNFMAVKTLPIPQLSGVGAMLGAVASPANGALFVSAGNQGGSTGHLVKIDLTSDTVTWARSYPFDMDSAALSPDGQTLYQATGAMATQGLWELISTGDGGVMGTIDTGGTGSHDTIVTLDGTKVLMGPRHSNYLVVASTATHAILQRIGPTASGIRPFTIDGKARWAFINTGGLNGFYVGDVATGQILYTVTMPNFAAVGSCGGTHGVSLSPDERELYLIDCSYNRAHVFDVTGLPGAAPVDVADIALRTSINGEGWISHTRDGRYVLVGDCGDVIDTATRNVVGNLPALQNTGIFTEVDFQNGAVVFSPLSRNQGGYVQ